METPTRRDAGCILNLVVMSRFFSCLAWIILVLPIGLRAQDRCASVPTYTYCDLVFELNDQEAAAHPNPFTSVTLDVEFRSPRHRTFLMPSFWDGGRRIVVRFTPAGEGQWDYRVNSNITRFDGKQGSVQATASDSPGFIRVANVHHFQYTEGLKPHLWMGDTCYRFGFLDMALLRQIADTRSAQKFNHLRGLALGFQEDAAKIFPKPDQPKVEHFQALDERILYLNQKGIVVDLVLGADQDNLAQLFPTWQDRERYIRYMIARYSPMNITWQGVQEFEEYTDGRGLLKEIGKLLKENDPFSHPRSTHAVTTSAPLIDDGWMNYITYQSHSDELGSVEHQLYAAPQVNAEFAYENSGAGASHDHHVDTDTFRKRLWNASMNGQYPTYGNTGTYGGRKFQVDAKYLDAPGAKQMTAWFDFFSATRHWDLEPYFDVDGGRALALESVEYIVYVEKPGPVEMLVEKKSYDVAWFNPINGEWTREKKEFKGDRFMGQPPTLDHDWVLLVSREGRKEGMLKSYKFESRRVILQEPESDPKNVPFEIIAPTGDKLAMGDTIPFAAKVTKETRATKAMKWLWTAEVSADLRGYRIVGSGQQGTWKLPAGVATKFPATMHLRLYGLNGVGKLYFLDKIFELSQ